MKKAIDEVSRGCSIRSAAIMYGIPRSTLSDHVNGKSSGRSGGAYLSQEEELELADFLCEAASIGIPRTRKDVLALVQNILSSRGRDVTVTMGWMDRFMQRHPRISLKSAVPLSKSRAKATDADALQKYFDLLETCFKDNGIEDPDQIYNRDETGLPMNPPSQKVLASKGKQVCRITGNDKSQTTVLACTCATGTVLPPFIVIDRQTLHPSFANGEVPGTYYGTSTNGWMNQELFQGWFTKLFLEHIPPKRPVVLLMDGHSSHYCPNTIRCAAEHQVILFTLPPNTTHITQPLDRACFAPLKLAWREECHHFQTTHPGKVVNRIDFSGIFARAWYRSMKMDTIIAGFRVAGIHPLNKEALLKDLPITKPQADAEVSKSKVLAFVPMLSPFPPRRGSSDSPYTPNVPKCESAHHRTDPKPVNADHLESKDTCPTPSCMLAYRHTSAISSFLRHPGNQTDAITNKKEVRVGKVLTSVENLKMLEEKEHQKAQKEEMRRQRQYLRESKMKHG